MRAVILIGLILLSSAINKDVLGGENSIEFFAYMFVAVSIMDVVEFFRK